MSKDRTKPLPSRNRVMELFDYCPLAGEFRYKKKAQYSVEVGAIAGGICTTTGYRRIRVDGKKFKASRLAWLVHVGHPVPFEIDHINRCRTEDRIANLRNGEVDNMRNKSIYKTSSSGVSGVNWKPKKKVWSARIQIDGNRIFLGEFSNKKLAIVARRSAEKALRAVGEWVKWVVSIQQTRMAALGCCRETSTTGKRD